VERDGDFELVTLRNGARAVRHVGHGEVMHPSVGPWQEAVALYAEQSCLSEKLQQEGAPLCIWDVGLGAGTNAVAALTAAANLGAAQRRRLCIVSFELDLGPLRLALGDAAGFPFLLPFAQAARTLATAKRFRDGLLEWELHLGDATTLWREATRPPDLIYFDPFSPVSNPDLWTAPTFERLHEAASEADAGCCLYTYSAATPTRVSLLLGGFFVGTGSATGLKAETTVAATRLELLDKPLDRRWLERWERSSSRAPHGARLTPEIESGVRGHAQFKMPAR
jgi:tRNA U34 5-methylaminomethyl-2-thiouridine-forming methyltransferase MnmC